jgi:dTDP-4-dehydrorhamnose reductase
MIFVTGSGGMVGSYLGRVFDPKDLYRTDLAAGEGIALLDTRDPDAVSRMIGEVKPATVLHLAAETDVDRCEREPDHAYLSNTMATLNVALACVEHGAEIVYVSTAGVFDGMKGAPYTEFDRPSPVTVYAKAKYEGEKIVQSICQRWYVVRAGWMFGGGYRDKKFVGKIAAQCLNNVKEIRCVNDKFGSPTYAKDLLDMVKMIVNRRMYGLYHGVNQGWCSRYDVAMEIASYMKSTTQIVSASSDDFPLSAPRPTSEAAVSYKLQLLGLNQMRSWKDALHDYLDAWQQENKAAVSAGMAAGH